MGAFRILLTSTHFLCEIGEYAATCLASLFHTLRIGLSVVIFVNRLIAAILGYLFRDWDIQDRIEEGQAIPLPPRQLDMLLIVAIIPGGMGGSALNPLLFGYAQPVQDRLMRWCEAEDGTKVVYPRGEPRHPVEKGSTGEVDKVRTLIGRRED